MPPCVEANLHAAKLSGSCADAAVVPVGLPVLPPKVPGVRDRRHDKTRHPACQSKVGSTRRLRGSRPHHLVCQVPRLAALSQIRPPTPPTPPPLSNWTCVVFQGGKACGRSHGNLSLPKVRALLSISALQSASKGSAVCVADLCVQARHDVS